MDGHLYNRRRLSTTKVTQTKVSKSKCDGAMLLHKPIFRGVAVSNSRDQLRISRSIVVVRIRGYF